MWELDVTLYPPTEAPGRRSIAFQESTSQSFRPLFLHVFCHCVTVTVLATSSRKEEFQVPTIRGGYRLIGVSGVAVAVDSIPNNYAAVADLYHLDANDSYILHGGYVGAEFNW